MTNQFSKGLSIGLIIGYLTGVASILLWAAIISSPALAQTQDICTDTLTNDFPLRDAVQPPIDQWQETRNFNSWGPASLDFPDVTPPEGCDPIEWKQQRILAVADKIITDGYNYCHHHVPYWDPPASEPQRCSPHGVGDMGVDCSNFTSWVYNYALGMKFTSGVEKQAEGPVAPGQRIDTKDFQPGDLIFTKRSDGKIIHVMLWTGYQVGINFDPQRLTLYFRSRAKHGDYVIADSNGIGPRYRLYKYYRTAFSHARRIIY